jgi:hypothetical protein
MVSNNNPDGSDRADIQNVNFNSTVLQLVTQENSDATRNMTK